MILENFEEELDSMEENTIIEEHLKYLDSAFTVDLESYINDYSIFEATLRRDFCEVLREQDEDNKDEEKSEDKKETSGTDRNFLQRIWDKILELFGKIKEKISSIINYFCDQFEKYQREKIEKIKLKYYKYYKVANSADLNNITIDFVLPNEKIFKDGILDFEVVLPKGFGVPSYDSVDGQIGGHKGSAGQHVETNEKDDKGNVIYRQKNKKDITEEIQKRIWGDNKDKGKVDKPFKYIKVTSLLDIIGSSRKGINYIKEKKNEEIKKIKKQEDIAKKAKKEASKRNSKDESKVKAAKEYLESLSQYQKVSLGYYTIYLKEYKKVFDSFTKLYIKGGESLKKIYGNVNTNISNGSNTTFNDNNNLGNNPNPNKDDKEKSNEESFISNEYSDALVEATMYELSI